MEEVPFLNVPDATQTFDPRLVKTTAPDVVEPEDPAPAIENPAVSLALPGDNPFITPAVEV
jgi:hypothetical protein